MRHLRFAFLGAIALVLLELAQSSAPAQSVAHPQNRDMVQGLYGSPVSEVYRTPKSVTVTASFASSGDLCRADIRGADETMTDEELNPVLEELAPKDARGRHKINTFLNFTCLKVVKAKNPTPNSGEKPATEVVPDVCSECGGVSEDYERVTITKLGNTNEYSSAHITYHRPECKSFAKPSE